MKFNLKNLRLSLITATLVACSLVHAGWRDDAPAIKDPFEGLVQKAALKDGSQLPIRDAGLKRVAIILTDNTNTHLKWSDEAAGMGVTGADKVFGTLFAGKARIDESSRMIGETYRSNAIIAAVVKPFVDTCKEVKVMSDLAEFKESGFELAAIVDVTFKNRFDDMPFLGGYEAGAYLKAWLITSSFTTGPMVSVIKDKQIGRDNFLQGVSALRTIAFSEFQASVKQALGGIDKTVLPAAAVLKSPEDRLREIEKLRRDGLITDSELSEKRQQILKGL